LAQSLGYVRITSARHRVFAVNRGDGEDFMSEQRADRGGTRDAWSWWYLLFVIEFLGAIWPTLFNKVEPSWIGIPFFYWYQMAWVIVCSVLTAIVYFATE
jgi:hypothetical protein